MGMGVLTDPPDGFWAEKRVTAKGNPGESDPTGKQPSEPGAKMDCGKVKAGLLADFSLALRAVAEVCDFGTRKYTEQGWLSVPDGLRRYEDAKWRHLLARNSGPIDQDSGLLHVAHEAWNALAVLELTLRAQRSKESDLWKPDSLKHVVEEKK